MADSRVTTILFRLSSIFIGRSGSSVVPWVASVGRNAGVKVLVGRGHRGTSIGFHWQPNDTRVALTFSFARASCHIATQKGIVVVLFVVVEWASPSGFARFLNATSHPFHLLSLPSFLPSPTFTVFLLVLSPPFHT